MGPALTDAALGGQVDYRSLDRPAYARHNTALQREEQVSDNPAHMDEEYLDIPAFLRKQAD